MYASTKFKTLSLAVALGCASALSSAHALTLGEAVQTALESHPELKITERNKGAIAQELRQAKAGYFPTVDVNLGGGHERTYNATTRTRDEAAGEELYRSLVRSEARLTVSQMVFDGFATPSEVGQQKNRLNSAKYNVNETQQTTALNAIRSYMDVQRARELLYLARNNLSAHEKYLEQIKLRSQGGRGNKADVRQAEGRAALARANHIAALGDLKNAKASYVEAIGSMPEEEMAKVTAPRGSLLSSLEETMENALSKSPAVLSAVADVEAAKQAYRGTKSAFYPRLDLELEAASQNNLDGVVGTNDEYLAMARIRYNLYRGGADLARKRERTERLEEARDTLERDRRTVKQNVTQAWNNYQTAKARLVPLNQHVSSSKETKKAYRSQFDIGQRSLLDLLDTEIELFNAQSALINGRFAADFAVYEVLANTGNLVETVKSEM